jgi:hypothetical protein
LATSPQSRKAHLVSPQVKENNKFTLLLFALTDLIQLKIVPQASLFHPALPVFERRK